MTRADISIIEAMSSIWAPWFKDARTWAPWRTFLAVLFGLPLTDADLAVYHERSGRTKPPPSAGFTEAWLVCGRRAGKSFALALIACYLAIFRDWHPYLVPGELACIKIIATDRKQARTIHRYCRALLTKVPALADLVVHDGDDALELTNGVVIEIQTASFRSVRSYTVIALLADEISFWRTDDESANPDSEILAAVRPAMATIPGAMLLAASSPYARKGELWRAFRTFHGKDGRALVWHAPTREMNPTVPQHVIDEAMAEDPARASAEYGAMFRSDIETYIPREVIDLAVVAARTELPYDAGHHYVAFTDPSGGNANSFTLAIAYRDLSGRTVLALTRERRPPFSPEAVVAEFAAILQSYKITTVHGDHYAGEWPREQFRKYGVTYDTSDKPKSQLYLEALPLLTSLQVDLLDDSRLVNQIAALERRTARGGRDSVDHPPGAHDDLANSALGALVFAYAANRLIVPHDILAASTLPGHAAGAYMRQQKAQSQVDDRPLSPMERWRRDTSAAVVFGIPDPDAPPSANARARLSPSLTMLERSRQPRINPWDLERNWSRNG